MTRDDSSLEYWAEVRKKAQQLLNADPRQPSDWSDGDKLRLLAVIFDAADLKLGIFGSDLQVDLRRMADRLDIADLPLVKA